MGHMITLGEKNHFWKNTAAIITKVYASGNTAKLFFLSVDRHTQSMTAASAWLLQVDCIGLLVSSWGCRRGVLAFPAITLAGSFSLGQNIQVGIKVWANLHMNHLCNEYKFHTKLMEQASMIFKFIQCQVHWIFFINNVLLCYLVNRP